jgi:hypothetical protein
VASHGSGINLTMWTAPTEAAQSAIKGQLAITFVGQPVERATSQEW